MTAAVDPAAAQSEARKILAGRRYHGAPVPRPLHGVLRWIGDRMSSVGSWIGDRFSWVPHGLVPWFQAGGALIAAAIVVLVVVAIARANARSRASRADAGPSAVASAGDDPGALEAEAAEAEARGDLARAVRLRFRAGLVRLDRDAHAITYRPSIPTGAVRVELDSTTFDELADTFENITYGDAPAAPADTDDARREWPRVVAAARRR